MAKNRIRKKKQRRSSAVKKASGDPVKLSMEQMLERIPDKPILTTDEVRHVFNDCHTQTVYKMNARGDLKPYRSRSRGQANVYKRDEVEAAVRKRFVLVPLDSNEGLGDRGDDQDRGNSKAGKVRGSRRGARKGKASRGSRSRK